MCEYCGMFQRSEGCLGSFGCPTVQQESIKVNKYFMGHGLVHVMTGIINQNIQQLSFLV